jgi:hypothetical protein
MERRGGARGVHAGTARGQATLEASRQLSTLSVFDSWEGATAAARKHTNASIRQDLDDHGNESLMVAQAAGSAVDGIEHVQSELRTLRHDAAALRMTIDSSTNKVVPDSTFNGPPMEALIAERQLQPRLDAIVVEANTVDQELATAINMADGDIPVPLTFPGTPLGAPPPGHNAPSADSATPTSPDKQFGNQFAANARKLKLVHAELEAACST